MPRSVFARRSFLIGLAVGALVVFLLLRSCLSAPQAPAEVEQRAPVDRVSPPRVEAAELSVPESSPTPERQGRDVERATETPAAPPVGPGDIAGRVTFHDGSIPPPLGLRFSPYVPDGSPASAWARAHAENRGCLPEVVADTDAEGRFVAKGLCEGSYRASAIRPAGIGYANGVFAPPTTDAHVVLGGYLLIVQTVQLGVGSIGRVHLTARYLRDISADYPNPAPMLIGGRSTDENGTAYFWLPDPGEVVLKVLGSPPDDQELVSLRGIPGLVRRQLVMPLRPAMADLRLTLTSCDESHVPVQDYCVYLDDASTGMEVMRLCSEDAVDGGLFHGIPPGRYRLSPTPRYSGSPVFYLHPSRESGPVIDLADGDKGLISLCVPMGGRIQLVARSVTVLADGNTPQVQATVSVADGAPTRLSFRTPLVDGLRIGFDLPVGTERVADPVLLPGEYVLKVTADGHRDWEKTVTLKAGEVTRLEVTLTPL